MATITHPDEDYLEVDYKDIKIYRGIETDEDAVPTYDLETNCERTVKASEVIKALDGKDSDTAARLISQGADLNIKDYKGLTALHYAVKRNCKVVYMLISKGADVNCLTLKHKTPLMYSSQSNQAAITSAFIKYGANVNSENLKGETALFYAVRNGHSDVVDLLLEAQADVNHEDISGQSPILLAVQGKDLNIVKKLLSHGAHVDHRDKSGMSALLISCKNGYEEIVNHLLSATVKADPNITEHDGWTSLMHACNNTHLNILMSLLSHGADDRICSTRGYTAYSIACFRERKVRVSICLNWLNIGLIRRLLPKPEETHCPERTSFMLHKSCSDDTLKKPMEVFKDCLNGSCINSRDVEGRTPLLKCVIKGCRERISMLLSAGADTNLSDYDGTTPLMMAVTNCDRLTVKSLLDAGSDARIADKTGKTSLMLAVDRSLRDNEEEEVIELLLTSETDINAQTFEGWTSLMFAGKHGNVSVVDRLLAKGADSYLCNKNGATAFKISKSGGNTKASESLHKALKAENCMRIIAKGILHFAERKIPEDLACHLLHQMVPKFTHKNGKSALHLAAQAGQEDRVKEILEAGAELSAKDVDCRTVLMVAAHTCNINILSFLIHMKVNLDQSDKAGWTALMYSAQHGARDCMETLISHGAGLELQCDSGDTALSICVANDHEKSVRFLLAKGANVNCKNKNGFTPLMLATNNGNLDIVKCLLSRDALLHWREFTENNTALHIACERGRTEIACTLINPEIDLDRRNGWRQTVLHICSFKGNIAIAKRLLQMGASVNLTDADGSTALMLSVSKRHHEVSKMLIIDAGAQINPRNKHNKTALQIGAELGCQQSVDIILMSGRCSQTEMEEALQAAQRNNHTSIEEAISKFLMQTDAQLAKGSSKSTNTSRPSNLESDKNKSENNIQGKVILERAMEVARNQHSQDVSVLEDDVRNMDLSPVAGSPIERPVVYNVQICADHIGVLSTATGGISMSREDVDDAGS